MAGTEWASRELLVFFQLILKHQGLTFHLATALDHTYVFILFFEGWKKEMVGCCHIFSLTVVLKKKNAHRDPGITGGPSGVHVVWFNHGNEKHQAETTLSKLWPLKDGREMNWCLWFNKKPLIDTVCPSSKPQKHPPFLFFSSLLTLTYFKCPLKLKYMLKY